MTRETMVAVQGGDFGRYVPFRRLGQGGAGIVFAAYDPQLDRRVAVKVIRPRGALGEASGAALTRLVRESKALAKLAHPNVVEIYDVGDHHGGLFLVTELVEGTTLRAWYETRPSWRRVLDVLEQAGRGLSHAHAAGLVHRDFKPENVMLRSDGRAKVLDFGLVQMHVEQSDARRVTTEVRGDVGDRLTETGSVMGTPAYMAPEQHQGDDADHRTDQFAFCVALWEGLYGTRPFRGIDLDALADAVAAGRVEAVPRRSAVPDRVRVVVERGLQADPQRRYPSMDELLRQLRRATRSRWPAVAVSASTLAVVGAFAVPTMDTEAPGACSSDVPVAEVWNPRRRAALEQSIGGFDVPYAKATHATVQREVEAYITHWRSQYDAACGAERVSGDRVVGCLAEGLSELDAVLAVVEAPSEAEVRNAPRFIARLHDPEACASDPNRIPSPPPEIEAEVVSLRHQTAQARVQFWTGRYAQGKALIEPIVARSDELGYEPLRAQARLQAGLLAMSSGEYERAHEAFTEAYFSGRAAEMPALAAEAAGQLVVVLGVHLSRPEAAQTWVGHARAALQRHPLPVQEALLEFALGQLAGRRGDFDAKLEHISRAVELRTEVFGAEGIETVTMRYELGLAHRYLGQYHRAVDQYEWVIPRIEAAFGADHPRVGVALNSLGTSLRRGGHVAESDVAYARSLEILRASVDADNPDLASTLNNVGTAAMGHQQYAKARDMFDEALQINRRVYGDDSPNLIPFLANLGAALSALEQHDQALATNEQTLALFERTLGREHPNYFRVLSLHGSALMKMGRTQQARDALERALVGEERTAGANHPDLASSLLAVADARRRTGDLEGAQRAYVRARDLARGAHGEEHPDVGAACHGLGEVHLDAGRRAEATAAFERALRVKTALDVPAQELAETREALARASAKR